jgi:hypothetical protein
MKQMNSRNPQAAAANPQMQTMQKFFPIIFGVIYLRVPAGATIYMVISSAMRIGTQEVMFRSGMVEPVSVEREIGSAKEKEEKAKPKPIAPPPAAKKKSTATDGTGVSGGTVPPAKSGGGGNGNRASNGRKPSGSSGRRPTNGRTNSKAADDEAESASKAHPRSRSKRTRKAR